MRNLLFILFTGLLFAGCKKNEDNTVTVVPITPSNLTATVISTTQVDLSWTDKSTNEDGFKIQRKTGIGNFADITTVGKDVTKYSDNGLNPNTTYTYRVYATNSAGASLGYTDEVIVTTFGAAVLTTNAIANISNTSAKSGGTISSDGGSPITARGIVWGTTPNPTIALTTKTSDGTGTVPFTSNLTGLTANTTYYVRAYATNSAGTAYGNEVNFTTSQPPENLGSVTDISGNAYPTVKIGTQVWMAENLRTTKYRDGSNIPVVTNNMQWLNNWNNSNPPQQPMMCWYNNDQATYTTNKFGALYNWYAINPATNGNKNVCPTGWHVPTDAEWTTLTTFLGGEPVAGGKMKSTGTQYWQSPNAGATNSSGWTGLPGGSRDPDGLFYVVGYNGFWWTSTEDNTSSAYNRYLSYNNGDVIRNRLQKTFGFSVRCLKD